MTKIRIFFLSLVVLCLGVPTGVAAQADPAVVGRFSLVPDLPFFPVHLNMLPTGKVMFWGVGGENGDKPQLWDPLTQTTVALPLPGYDMFCVGHSFMADGQLCITGGHIANDDGLPNASIFNPFTNTWTTLPNMNAGRWYPTNTTLANGDVLVVSGINGNIGFDPLPQIYETKTGAWRDLTSAQLSMDLYPRMHLAPNGKVFNSGPSATTRYLDTSGTGAWTVVGNTFNNYYRDYGSSVLYDTGKVLIMGGGDPPTASAEVIDLNATSPTWRAVAPMAFARRHVNATLLPDGKVLVNGGTYGPGLNNPDTPVFAAEMWDPATETWTTMASAQIPRLYHSATVLMPDGRVLTTGGNGYPTPEIYEPPYLFKGARPTISSAPASVTYNQTFFVQTPDVSSITQVTLIRLSTTTHAFNQDQRISRLSFTQTAGGLNVVAPANSNLAPVGYYMLFLLNGNGVPSVAKMVQVYDASATLETNLTATPANPSNTTSASFSFTSTAANSTFTCSLDTSSFTACTSPKSYTSLTNGSHTFQVRATDAFNNTDPSPAGFTWTIDTIPPDTSITATPLSLTSSTNASFSFTSTEASSSFQCQLDGGGFGACTTPTSYTALSSGSHTFQVRATDAAGNTDPTPASFTWTINIAVVNFIDTTVADFSSGTPDANTYISQTTDGEVILAPTIGSEFFGTALPTGWFSIPYDPGAGGSARVTSGSLILDGTLILTTATTLFGPGRSLEFVATFSATSQGIGFGQTFSNPPWAFFDTKPDGLLYARTNNGTVIDTQIPGNWLGAPHRYRIDWNLSSVVYWIDGTQVASHSLAISDNMRPLVTDIPIGDSTLSVNWLRMTPYAASGTFLSRIVDEGSSVTWGTATWTNDTPAGTSLVISVRQGNTPTPDGSWTAFTPLSGSGAVISGSSRYLQYRAQLSTTVAGLTPTLNDINIVANTGNADTTPPDTTITASPALASSSPNASFSFTSTKANSTFACSLDGGPFAACSSPQSYSNLANGSHTFQVRATDPANNTDPTPASFTWSIATVDTTITANPPAVTNSTSATFSFTATAANSTFTCSIDGATFTACSSPQSYSNLAASSFTSTPHVFQVRATDPANNTDPSPASYTWKIDISPPDTTITATPTNPTNSTSATFSFTSTKAGSSFQCQLDGGGFVACTTPSSYTALGSGSHTFQVRAIDPANNTDPTPDSYTWNINITVVNLIDSTVADFSSGTLDANTYLSQTVDGEVILAPTVGAEFSGTALPTGWFSSPYDTGGGTNVTGGSLIVDGALIGTNAFFAPGRSLEFVATFSLANQHIGFGETLLTSPWAIFSTKNTGDGLYARTNNGSSVIDTLIPGNWLGAPHRYRIDWNLSSLVYWIDGVQVASHSLAISGNMRPLIIDFIIGGGSLSVDWIRLTPYSASATFLSRVFDAGASVSWNAATWTSDTPAGTTLVISARQGNTPAPDNTWTGFSPLSGSGAPISGSSRYLQYRAVLTSSNPGQTPALNNITITSGSGGSGPDTTPPVRSNGVPTGNLPSETTQTTLSLNTDENAACRYSRTSGTAYASMTNTFATTGTTFHSTSVSGLQNGQTYNFYVRCQDSIGNSNTDDFPISFSVASPLLPSSSLGLIGYWNFDNGTGADASGNGNNGALVNGPTVVPGRSGNGLNFNGVNGVSNAATPHVEVGPNALFDISSHFTISAWVKSSTLSTQGPSDVVFHNGWWTLSFGAPGPGNIRLFDTNGSGARVTATYSDNAWHQIVAVQSGSTVQTIKIYVDGVSQNLTTAGSWNPSQTPNQTVNIGGSPGGGNGGFSGQIDEVRIYNRALDVTEIRSSVHARAVDFDGDGKSDIGIYRSGSWSISRSSDGGHTVVELGTPSDIPVPADYDGDGITDEAVYSNGLWTIKRSSDGGTTVAGWGGTGFIPVPADYDGDGKADIAVYHPSGVWSIVRSSDGGNTLVALGGPDFIPVPADYDGDGKADIAVYHTLGVWSILRSSDGGNTLVAWGGPNFVPVPADYDADGKADVAVYHPIGVWSVKRSSDGGNTLMGWGGANFIPVPADYDGDGKADIAVYHPLGVWSIVRSSDGGNTLVGWGGDPHDIPLK